MVRLGLRCTAAPPTHLWSARPHMAEPASSARARRTMAHVAEPRPRSRLELCRRAVRRRPAPAADVVVRTGTLVEATLIPSTSVQQDEEARWAGHRRRQPVHGYKAHVA